MTSMRKVLGLLAALALGSFALPAAATYYYSLNMCAYPGGCPPVPPNAPIAMTTAGTASTATVTAIVKNESPANYTFKSFSLAVPSLSPLMITNGSATLTPSSGAVVSSAAVVYVTGSKSINVNNVSVPRGKSITVTLTVTVNNVCTPPLISGSWAAAPWTGTSVGSGSKWTAYPASLSHPAMTLSTACNYTIGGTATGLAGTVVLQNNGGDNLTVSANGSFTFVAPAGSGAGYSVTVLTQPTGQTCTVANGSGTVGTANVTNVSVSCAVNTFTIGGTATGLTGTVVLQNNGGDNLSVSANSGFTFGTPVSSGGSYNVTVLTQPDKQTCTVSSGSGSNVTANVSSVAVNCTANTLGITSPPTSATAGTPFNVTVGINPPDTNAGVAMTSNCGATETHSTAPDGSSTTFLVTIAKTPTSGVCTINFAATGYQGISLPPLKVSNGVVGCTLENNYVNNGTVDPDLTYVDLSKATSGDWGLRRGPNMDGNTCTPVNVQLITDGNTAHFIYDKGDPPQQGAFKYTLVWPEQPVDSSGPTTSWTDNRPQVAWVTDMSSAPVYVPALTCVDDDLTLADPLNALMPDIPAVLPFTALAGTYPQYAPGQKARMCVAQHGWSSNQKSGGIIQVIYWDKVVDLADGYVIRSP